MTTSLLRSVIVLVGVTLLSYTSAEEAVVPEVSKKPLAAMQRLAPLAGAWDLTVYFSPDDGVTWNESPSQVVNIEYGHKGFMLEEVPASLDGPGFHMHNIVSYDQYRDVYRKVAIDDIWGIPDLYEGQIEDGKLVLTNLKSGTLFPLENGTWRGYRLTLELKPDERWMWVDKTDDNGATWQPSFKMAFVKRAE